MNTHVKVSGQKSVKDILASKPIGDTLEVRGWIRTKRKSKNVIFIALNDGSSISSLQIVLDAVTINEDIEKNLNTGTAIQVSGNIIESLGGSQEVELAGKDLIILGECPIDEYPLQPKRHSMEFLRSILHLRMRTNTFGAVFRVRNQISYAIHKYFNERDFVYLNTPIITSVDAEGAGEMFTVTSFDLDNSGQKINFAEDFFGKKTSLTVSGQLTGETGALALGKIYTFGPTFRAENSNTSRHLAEFWMVEPEMAFYDLNDNIDLAEDFVKYIISHVLTHSKEDIEFLDKRYSDIQKQKAEKERSNRGLLENLEKILSEPFEKISYDEAISILKNSKKNKKKKFKYIVEEWGIDLQTEHERYLTEIHFEKPVVVYNYPKDIKAFYMYQNDDNKTVAAMDVLLPGVGEIIGGSQREYRYDKLVASMDKHGVDRDQLDWFLETRKFGSVIHSGFGLGLERITQYITGMENIRDVIPYPRSKGTAEC